MRPVDSSVQRSHHPLVVAFPLGYEPLVIAARTGQALVFSTTEPGSLPQRARHLLATRSAQTAGEYG